MDRSEGARPAAWFDRRGALFVLSFLVVAAFLSWNADSRLGFGPDQIAYNLVTEELLSAWGEGRPLETEFGSVFRQSFALLHACGQLLLGSPEASYRLILFVSAFAYLVAMYLLLANVLQDRSIAALTAVLSIVQRYTIGTSFWGMGEYASILPRIVVLAVFPLAWLVFERFLGSRRVLVAFVVVALGFALHLSAAYFFCILLMTYGLYVLWSRSWSTWLEVAAATALFFFAVKAVPNPAWSWLMEKMPQEAVPVALMGFVLVLHTALSTSGRGWTALTILWLTLGSLWLFEGVGVQTLVGLKTEEERRIKAEQMAESERAQLRMIEAKRRARVAQQAQAAKQGQAAEPVPVFEPAETAGSAAFPEQAQVAELRPPELAEQQVVAAETREGAEVAAEGSRHAGDDSRVIPEEQRLKALNEALYARFGWTLFPISLATLGFALFNGGLLAAIALYEWIRRWRRGPKRREVVAAMYVVSVFTVSLGLTGALQLYSRWTGQPDIVLELFRAFRFIHLPLYVYLGLFLERAWRQSAGVRPRLLLGLLVFLLLLPPRQALAALPDRVKLLVREVAERSSSLQQGDPSQRMYLENLLATGAERRAAVERHNDFVELGNWVRHSTPEQAVFMTTDYNFIHHADRDIMVSYAQGAGSARSMAVRSGHQAWHEAYVAISGAFASKSPERILAVGREYRVDYIVTAVDQPALAAAEVYTNRSYRLYRLESRTD